LVRWVSPMTEIAAIDIDQACLLKWKTAEHIFTFGCMWQQIACVASCSEAAQWMAYYHRYEVIELTTESHERRFISAPTLEAYYFWCY